MRLLALSLGNTSLFGGVFNDENLGVTFRRPVHGAPSTFPTRGAIDRVVLCSVVPEVTDRWVRAMRRRYRIEPLILTTGSAHGVKIGYIRPRTLGTDRLAAAVGAKRLFPGRHVIVVDCGTATTVTALHRDGTLLGGAILPGLALWPDMLATRTAQLPRTPLRAPKAALGRSTKDGIAAGIFFGHLGAIRELVGRVQNEAFGRSAVTVIGTGGHALRFAEEKIFNELEPALVLHGLRAFAE